jgi:hypothetical protein
MSRKYFYYSLLAVTFIPYFFLINDIGNMQDPSKFKGLGGGIYNFTVIMNSVQSIFNMWPFFIIPSVISLLLWKWKKVAVCKKIFLLILLNYFIYTMIPLSVFYIKIMP